MVNVREAHPGKNVPQLQSMDQKIADAEHLRCIHRFDFEVAADDIDGTLHRVLSHKPNSAYIVGREGTILFRAQWINDTSALAEAQVSVTEGTSLRRLQSKELVRPMLSMLRYGAPAFDRAGKGGWSGMWLSMRPLAFISIVLKALRFSPRS